MTEKIGRKWAMKKQKAVMFAIRGMVLVRDINLDLYLSLLPQGKESGIGKRE